MGNNNSVNKIISSEHEIYYTSADVQPLTYTVYERNQFKSII